MVASNPSPSYRVPRALLIGVLGLLSTSLVACGLGLTPRESTSAAPSSRELRLEGAGASTSIATSAGPPRPLRDVDTSKLDARGADAFWQLVSSVYAPCPDTAATLVECIEQGRACAACVPMAQLLVAQVEQGNAGANARAAAEARFGPDGIRDVPIEGAPSKGALAAPVTIVVFSDFECPACKAMLPVLEELVATKSPDVRLVHKFYPLPKHTRAKEAAYAAVAAMNQGKYWEMERMIFEHQDALSDADLERYAGEVGLDRARFRADFVSPATRALVERDRAHGEAAGLTHTPFVLINGRVFDTTYFRGKGDLVSWIDTEIALAKAKRTR
jgi:protein-disulfide isomerase